MSDEATLLQSEFVQELLSPISDAAPCGEDPKYSLEFDFIKTEMAKTSTRDFEKVIENSQEIINNQAKDVTTLAYYAVALLQEAQCEKFCGALVAIAELMTKEWDNFFPTRERARINTLKWLNEERTVGTIEKYEPSSSDHTALSDALAALNVVKQLCFDKYPDNPPSIKDFQNVVEKWVKETKPKEEPKPEAKEEPKEEKKETPKPAAAAPIMPQGDLNTASEINMALQKLAFQILQGDPANAIAYRMIRMLKWSKLEVVPENNNGVTQFEPPVPQRVSYFENKVSQQLWQDVIVDGGPVIAEPGLQYWFDLQYYMHQALTAKGGDYAKCGEVIIDELLSIVSRLPQILDLKFKDETPFANVVTKEWIQNEQAERGGGGGGAASSAVKTADLEADLEKASDLISKGKFEVAIQLINSGCDYGTLKEKCERKLEMARLCFLNKQLKVAQGILEQLCELIEHKNLDDWDTEFCSSVWEQTIKVYLGLIEETSTDESKVHSMRDHAEKIFNKLTKIDPYKAITLKFI